MPLVSFEKFTQRILDVLKADESFAKKIAEFRLGDMGDTEDREVFSDDYPLVYVTTASNPEVSRKAITPVPGNALPGQEIVYEFWAVIVVNGEEPYEIQKQLYQLTTDAQNIIAKNIRLQKPGVGEEEDEDADRLCATLDVFTQRRHEKHRGELVEAMTIRIRPTVFVTYE